MRSQKGALILICILLLVGGFLRFYNLNWGAPFYFHPDERNIASSISQLSFPENFNPNFFAYGSLPIYTIYFLGLLSNLFVQCQLSPVNCSVSFEQAIVLSRIISAIFSLTLIPIIYILGKRLHSPSVGLLAALLMTFSTGIIQFSHFGTFELWLTFFSVLLFLTCLNVMKKGKVLDIFFMALCLGALVAIKISSLALFPLPLLSILFYHFTTRKKRHYVRTLSTIFIQWGVVFITAAALYFLTNPYVLLDTPAFRNSMTYESSLAVGTLPVFYTGEFYDTLPILYHFQRIYPFLLNPLLVALFLPSLAFVVVQAFQEKNSAYFLLIAFYTLLFFSQAFLFVKWVRYLVPTLPFMYLILALSLFHYLVFLKQQTLRILTLSIISVLSVLFAISYFITSFIEPDTRLQALEYAQKSIPQTSPILSEVYDLGIVPFNAFYPAITLFNTYELESSTPLSNRQSFEEELRKNDYVILPSQRVYKTRIQNVTQFPIGHDVYTALLSGGSGYHIVYKTPCSMWCRIAYLGSPVSSFEGTATVFDKPQIIILKKL